MDNLCNDCNKVTLHKCRRRRQSKRRIPSVRTSIPDELAQLITQLIDDEVNYVKILKEFLHMEDVYRMDVPFSQRNNLLFESPSFLLPIYKLHQNYLLPLLKTVQTCDQVCEKFIFYIVLFAFVSILLENMLSMNACHLEAYSPLLSFRQREMQHTGDFQHNPQSDDLM